MTEYEFIRIVYKKYRASNSDGTGKILNLEDKSVEIKMTDTDKKAISVKRLYRELKKVF